MGGFRTLRRFRASATDAFGVASSFLAQLVTLLIGYHVVSMLPCARIPRIV